MIGQLAKRGVRQAQRLFHMLMALAFLGLAAVGAELSFSEWRFYEKAPQSGLVRFAMFAGFTVMLILFGLHSFLKARSVK